MPINTIEVKTILVVRNDRFGEFLLNIPALRALKETFPKAKISALVNPAVKELAGCLESIDEIVEWSQGRHSFFQKLKLLSQIKSKKPDIAVIFNPAQELNIITYLAGIPVRVGYDRKWGFLLTHKMKDLKYLGLKHEVDYNLELVSLIQATTTDKTLSIKIDDGIIKKTLEEYGLEGCDNCVALHPWASDPIKRWPARNFRRLAKMILKEKAIKLILVGGGENSAESRALFSGLGENFTDLTGKIPLLKLAALLKRCKLLISGDSGPMHLACAVGTPVVAIFRNDIPGKHPRRWGPWGNGNIIIAKPNLQDITVDEVFNELVMS
ncbi:glycosyltransferase family 9 protein [bacterium]|nr:MAG: glycosyltransferase family 9 protein [bacterium]